MNKLRYKRGRSRALVRASVFDLPFHTDYYDAVVFSQVIEHLPRDPTHSLAKWCGTPAPAAT